MFKFDPNSTEKQGRWRLRSPSEFSRMWTKHDLQAKGVSYIVGLLRNEFTETKKGLKRPKFGIQSVRFDRSFWTEKKAAVWWKKNKSRFEKYWTAEDWKKKWKEPKTQRKNPFTKKLDEIPLTPDEIKDLFHYLNIAIQFGNPRELISAIALTKNGDQCTDCEKNSLICYCEFCPDCKFRRCICKYNIEFFDVSSTLFTDKKRNHVRKLAWNFAKYLLSEQMFQIFVQNLLYELKFFRENENNYLKNFIKSMQSRRKYEKEN